MASTFGGAPQKCPRCAKSVYMAEEIIAAGKKYHRNCLKCKECNKQLEPREMSDRDGEVYCSRCYGRLFGPSGYGYGQGAGVLSSEAPAPAPKKTTTTTTAKSNNKAGPFCTQCGAGGQSGTFCTECGRPPQATASSPPPPPPQSQLPADVCPNCKAPGQLKAFCSMCGFNKSSKFTPTVASGAGEHQKPVWVRDDASPNCMKCSSAFSFTNRRHHCRKCGMLVCNECSDNKMKLPWEESLARVCNQCYQQQ